MKSLRETHPFRLSKYMQMYKLINKFFVYYTGSANAELRDIVCSDASSISFDIYIPDITQWEGSADQRSWSLNDKDDEACQPTFDDVSGLVSYSNIDVATCADDPGITPDSSKFEYEFVISVLAVAGSAIAPATFAYDHDYVVKCFYNREQENIMASFQPRHSLTDTGSSKSKSN